VDLVAVTARGAMRAHRLLPKPSRCGALIDLSQVLAHVHQAEIEIGEAPGPPPATLS